ALLQTARVHGYSTAIETALNVPWENAKKVLEYTDILIHDIKMINSEEHKKWVGVSNEKILENIKKAYETFPQKKVIVRTPVIPGANDKEEVIEEIINFILPYKNIIKYELLPYHRLGLGKYEVLGREYELSEISSLGDKRIKELREFVSQRFENARK
ncbi:MAG: radical SAM protein, partial [Lachnospiraceae bacterium]|nr:radical SAM protein [Lachnospiraceae bacterium]